MYLGQFPDFLHSPSGGNGKIIVVGDFNFRFEKVYDSKVCQLWSLLNDCYLKQFVAFSEKA